MRRLSLVLFYDALGETAHLEDGWWDVKLHSLGAGLRYQTLIGPIRLDLGYLGPGVRVIPTFEYWASEFTMGELNDLAERINQHAGGFITGSDLAPIKWSDLSLSLDAQFVWNTPLRVLTFIGAGGGLHALNGQGNAVDNTFVEDLLDSITAGVNALLGFEFEPVSRIRLYAEGRYTALNSIQYLSARGGLQIMFNVDEQVVGAVVAPPPVRREAP